ncbi:hypothetical protein B296_00013463 [Ensete ventricosum]|uniref:4-coumarate--CoA ligase n=1 Tax=Ensete ventricosum TaxID=4639 RepID=A0A426ZAG9_ENSVE|nr:hypothetical protein B296_00013463 [Ensete ventricosum]
MDSAPQRRLRAIAGHLLASNDRDLNARLTANPTAGEFVLEWIISFHIMQHRATVLFFLRSCKLGNGMCTGRLLSFLSQIPSVRLIVVVGGIDEKMPSVASRTGVEIVTYSKLQSEVSYENGHSNLQPFSPPKPEDVATICYTSGTTGTPKVLKNFSMTK